MATVAAEHVNRIDATVTCLHLTNNNFEAHMSALGRWEIIYTALPYFLADESTFGASDEALWKCPNEHFLRIVSRHGAANINSLGGTIRCSRCDQDFAVPGEES